MAEFYLKAMEETAKRKGEGLDAYLKKDLLFKYGNVSRADFNKEYSTKGWLGRKIIALPAAIWSGVVKTVFHLAFAILYGVPAAIFSDSRKLKAILFCMARDVQESFGRLTSIFNDRFGLFHIQESRVQSKFYRSFIETLDKKNLDKPKTEPVETPPKKQVPKKDQIPKENEVPKKEPTPKKKPNSETSKPNSDGMQSQTFNESFKETAHFPFPQPAFFNFDYKGGDPFNRFFSEADFFYYPPQTFFSFGARGGNQAYDFSRKVNFGDREQEPTEQAVEEDSFEKSFDDGFFANSKAEERDSYAILELEKDATPDQIRAKYKELTRKHHPDKCRRKAGESEADFQERAKAHTERFAQIAQAYADLNVPAN